MIQQCYQENCHNMSQGILGSRATLFLHRQRWFSTRLLGGLVCVLMFQCCQATPLDSVFSDTDFLLCDCSYDHCNQIVSENEKECSVLTETRPANESAATISSDHVTTSTNHSRFSKATTNEVGVIKCKQVDKMLHIVTVERRCFAQWTLTMGDQDAKLLSKTTQMQTKDSTKIHCYSRTFSDITPQVALITCSCIGDYCNRNLSWREAIGINQTTFFEDTDSTETTQTMEAPLKNVQTEKLIFIIAVLFAIIAVSLVAYLAFRVFKRNRLRCPRDICKQSNSSIPQQIWQPPSQVTRNIEIESFLGSGRFGSVQLGKTEDGSLVAVKVFPPQDHQSWETEKDCYSYSQMSSHENILRLISAERFLETDPILILEYHPKGSLFDYLLLNTITWSQALRLTISVSRGLAFLHEDLTDDYSNNKPKPPIAHRDMKSKNILVKNDLTACIADFGLAFCVESTPVNHQHCLVQVGTVRYMAPEVLEGTTGTVSTLEDSLFQVDMYACGLILWELLSRCALDTVAEISPYQRPFEEEAGLHPTKKTMEELVCDNNYRPLIRQEWLYHQSYFLPHQGAAALCQTMCECWDRDPEARLTASCVLERTKLLQALDVQ